jgi:dTDP-glucose 4,6-dehydratase
MKKIVYVTGCLGFIGSYITRECLKNGWWVRGVDKITYAANEKLLCEFNKYKNFIFEKEDICKLGTLYDCDYIIDTAAETHVDNSIVRNDEFINSNILGVHNLLELIRKRNNYKMPVLLHFSTDEVYGDIAEGSHTELDLLKPSNPYSASKAAADQLILAWNRTYDVPYIIVRPTNNYGIGQYTEKLIPKTCKYLHIERKINLHNNGMPKRIWLHAKDTAEAILTIINSGSVNEIYNISGNYEQENLETVRKIIKDFHSTDHNFKKYIDFDIIRKGSDLRYSIDDSKLKSLGWSPKCNFDKELPEIIDFYRRNFVW